MNFAGDDNVQHRQLPSPLIYRDKRLVTVEDAAAFILNLPPEKLDEPHWRAAHAAFSCALMEPAYLKAALVALDLARTLDVLVNPNVLSPTC